MKILVNKDLNIKGSTILINNNTNTLVGARSAHWCQLKLKGLPDKGFTPPLTPPLGKGRGGFASAKPGWGNVDCDAQ